MNGAYVIENTDKFNALLSIKSHHFDQKGGLSFFQNVCFYVMYKFFGV